MSKTKPVLEVHEFSSNKKVDRNISNLSNYRGGYETRKIEKQDDK